MKEMENKIGIIRPLILMDRPGREVEHIGGFLSHLKFKLESFKISSINYDRYKPRVVYTVYENSKRILLEEQYKETAKIANILGFTWETIYTGRAHYNKLSKSTSCFTDLTTRYKRIIEFYKPDIVLCYNENFIINCFDDPENDFQQINTSLLSGSFTKYIPFVTFGNLGNFSFILTEQDQINKVKAIDCNKFYIRNDKHKYDIYKMMKYHGSRVDQKCAERFNIVQADNLTFKFLEG